MGPRYIHTKFPVATLSLVAANVVSFAAGFETTRFMLYLFSHAAIYHLIINMLVLWIFGSYLEARIGWKRFLIYYVLSALGSDMLWQAMDAWPLSGASGAISGLMALFFYRCRKAKKKAVIPIRLIAVNLDIHAGWFLYYWLLWHVYSPMYVDYNATYVGGFITGIIIGRVNRHRVKDKARDLLEKAVDYIDGHSGVGEAEQALLEAHKLDPEDPDVSLELGRLYSSRVDAITRDKGRRFYLESARHYYLGEKGREIAGDVFLEYFLTYTAPVEPETHLKYAAVLSHVYNHEGVTRILEPFIEGRDVRHDIAERIFLAYVDSALKAGLKERAEYAYEEFGEAFPDSSLLKKAAELLRTYRPEAEREMELKLSPSANTWERAARGVLEDINVVTSNVKRGDLLESDVRFWYLLFLVAYISPFLVPIMGLSSIVIVIIALPFAASLANRAIVSFFGGIYAGRGSSTEAEGLREFNLSFFMDKARACEREGKFEEAITYLKGVLKEDEENLYAMFQIAWLYHKKLHRAADAIREYRKFLESAPEGHPFRRDAYEGIKELSQPPSGDSQPA